MKNTTNWFCEKCNQVFDRDERCACGPNPALLVERDALAAKYFPDLWRAAQVSGKSKKRNQLRNAAEQVRTKERLRAQGASCGNCESFCPAGPCGSYCDLDTDFHGYSLTKPEHVCHRWTEKRHAG